MPGEVSAVKAGPGWTGGRRCHTDGGMEQRPRPSRLERTLEGALFASRWVLVPIYAGLAASLLVLLVSFGMKVVKLCLGLMEASTDDVIISVLSLIDLSLVANLVLIVVWAGYENFVSRLLAEEHPERPDWISHIGYSDLKIKLMTSIVAISAIHLLEDFMHVDATSDRHLGWSVGLHMAFVVSAVLLVVMDRLSPPHR
jgi:uncharacterized protein (TIGR00645 family)